jgi:hypothetical protein
LKHSLKKVRPRLRAVEKRVRWRTLMGTKHIQVALWISKWIFLGGIRCRDRSRATNLLTLSKQFSDFANR